MPDSAPEPPGPGPKRQSRNAALQLAFNVGPMFGGAMFAGWFIGSAIDARLGSAPVALTIGVLLGAVSGFIYLIRTARDLE